MVGRRDGFIAAEEALKGTPLRATIGMLELVEAVGLVEATTPEVVYPDLVVETREEAASEGPLTWLAGSIETASEELATGLGA